MSPTEQHKSHKDAIEVDILDCRILIVDDSLPIVKFIEMMLKAQGFTQLETASDGQEGLDKVDAFQPDLLILDIKMPVMDGLDVLKVLRGNKRHSDLPVIVETASETKEERNRILAAGGDDILSKPIDPGVLMARVKQHLTKRILVRQLVDYQLRLEAELDTARSMQAELMPKQAAVSELETRYDCKLLSQATTSSELGGDFWGIEPLDNDRFVIFIVDFSGHGVGAAINTFRLHTVMREIEKTDGSPSDYVRKLNDQLVNLLPIGQFATITYAILDCSKNILTYSGAASPYLIVGRDGGTRLESHECAGPPIGALSGITYEDRTIPFEKGDFLFLYSDALFESENTEGEIIGMDGVADFLEPHMHLETDDQFESVMNAFHAHAVKPLNDDLTAIWLIRN